MDKLKAFAQKAAGGSSSKPAEGAAPQGQDAGDKAFASLETKFGMKPNAERDEKITDAARGQFEKMTGKKVPEKYSN